MCFIDWISKIDLNSLATLVAAFAGAWGHFFLNLGEKVPKKNTSSAQLQTVDYMLSPRCGMFYINIIKM